MNLLGSPRAKKSMARCLVGCGSNLGARRDLLERAVELLRFMPGVNVLQTSHFRESKAVGGPVDQPAFLNGAFLLKISSTLSKLSRTPSNDNETSAGAHGQSTSTYSSTTH